ncbi:Conserved protein of uncharacterised function%2C (CpsA-related protein) [Mycobacterium tuberculosis]|nr:Conserved protein of uncharacterised function%2C (CpsA-related protein) [Mycobacterium tuberculosis]
MSLTTLTNDYSGPGSGLGGSDPNGVVSPARAFNLGSADDTTPPPSPILTAGSDAPECIN